MATFIETIGIRGSQAGLFLYPDGIAADRLGNIYVVDSGNARIQKFDSDGNFMEPSASELNPFNGKNDPSGNPEGYLTQPTKIAISSETNDEPNKVYVIEERHSKGVPGLVIFTLNGRFYSSITEPRFYKPVDVACSSGNILTIYVLEADDNSPQIKKFNALGSLTGYITLDDIPSAMAIDDAGVNSSSPKIWVAYSNHYIKRIVLSTGNVDLTFGEYGNKTSQFNDISGMFVDASNNIYVVDSNNYRIQKFDNSGNFLEAFGTFGSGNSQFNDPRGAVVVNNEYLYVTDNKNYRIQKFLSDQAPLAPAAVKPDNIPATWWGADSTKESNAIAPYLTAERDPINTVTPSLRWQFSDTDSGDKQSAYQVQIARTVDALGTYTQVYDSGVVEAFSVGGIGTHVVTTSLEYAGLYYYRIKLRDNYGLWSPWSIGRFTIDLEPPANPSITINEAPQTNQSTITLYLSAAGADVWEMIVSENSNFVGASWQYYQTMIEYSFTDIVGEVEKIKTLYAKFRDKAWNETSVASSTILIDTMPPTNSTVSVAVPDVAQYFDVDREVVPVKGEYIAFNGVNNYNDVDTIINENIVDLSVNSSATYIYYLSNKDIRKKNGYQVSQDGQAGTLAEFNAGADGGDFYIDGITGDPLTFVVNPNTGALTFSRVFNNDEKSRGVFVSYRTGKKTYRLSRSFIRRNPNLSETSGFTDEQLYVYLGKDPRSEDIRINDGVVPDGLSIVVIDAGDVGTDSSTSLLGTITFNRAPTIDEVGARVSLRKVASIDDYVLKVDNVFGLKLGGTITVGDSTTLYKISGVDVDNLEVYLEAKLSQSYAVGTLVCTSNQLKLDYYYGAKEFAVSSATVRFDLNSDGAKYVYIDGDIVTESGKTKEWVAYTTSKYVTLLPLNGDEIAYSWKKFGRRNVYFRFKDGAGNESDVITIPGGLWLDLRLPQFPDTPGIQPVYIAEGSVTNTQTINLIFNVLHSDEVEILVQGDVVQQKGVTNEWIDYPTSGVLTVLLTDSVTLSTSNDKTQGSKTIEVWYRTKALNTRGPSVLMITLDTSVALGTGQTFYYRVSVFT